MYPNNNNGQQPFPQQPYPNYPNYNNNQGPANMFPGGNQAPLPPVNPNFSGIPAPQAPQFPSLNGSDVTTVPSTTVAAPVAQDPSLGNIVGVSDQSGPDSNALVANPSSNNAL